MDKFDALVFSSLFKEACSKCFGHPLINPLSETESKMMYNQVLEYTGLVIGAKSIKNYSFYIVNDTTGKQENPSIATLDTLARYVLDAPYTDELQRKKSESHYPYWFQYKSKFQRDVKEIVLKRSWRWNRITLIAIVAIGVTGLFAIYLLKKGSANKFADDFHATAEDSLLRRGWFIQSKDTVYWNRRGEQNGGLSLFTLRGDNWPDPLNKPGIRNLLLRKITANCFTAELHVKDFVPRQNWQQVGVILLEDTVFVGKSARLSLAYNDFSGGYHNSGEILVQAITSLGKEFHQPEEIAHKAILNIDSAKSNPALIDNLLNLAFRIEKQGRKFRFLFANGSMENPAFKEVVSCDFDMQPKYIGIFALEGFVNQTNFIPARLTFFSLTDNSCE